MLIFFKLLGAVLVIGAFSTLGAIKSKGFYSRIKALQLSAQVVQAIGDKLAFSQASPWCITRELYKEKCFCNCDFLAVKEGESFNEQWEESVNNSTLPLVDDDKEIIMKIGEILGRADINTQQQQLSLILKQLEDRRALAQQTLQSDSRLTLVLCTLLGVAITILVF